jgi:hypothetical protein
MTVLLTTTIAMNDTTKEDGEYSDNADRER